jgi:hypothetical protein
VQARCGLVVLGLLVVSCIGDVRKQPVPPADKLKLQDCELGIAVYRELLQRPAYAGVVVTGRVPEAPSPEAQEQAATLFAGECHYQLAGRVRRTIVRCWSDSLDVTTFRRCNEKF